MSGSVSPVCFIYAFSFSVVPVEKNASTAVIRSITVSYTHLKHLRSYTCGALTISAGIAMFNEHYPIRAAAEQTAALEDEAKKLPGKNGAALFDAVPDHTYSWDVLQDLSLIHIYPALKILDSISGSIIAW